MVTGSLRERSGICARHKRDRNATKTSIVIPARAGPFRAKRRLDLYIITIITFKKPMSGMVIAFSIIRN